MDTLPRVYFTSSYKGYFYDSLQRLETSLDPHNRDLATQILRSWNLPEESHLPECDKYSLICPFNAPNASDPSFFSFLTERIVGDINNHACRVFFDNSNERCSVGIVEQLLRSLSDKGIRSTNGIRLICQDRALGAMVSIKVYPHDFFIVRSVCKLTEQVLPTLTHKKKPTHLFLCLNATPRPLRVWSLLELMRSNLWGPNALETCCLVSFPGFQYCKESGLDLEKLHLRLKSFGFENPGFYTSWLRANAPFIVDRTPYTGNDLSDIIDQSSYEHTVSSIVTETECYPSVRRVTEKTIKAFSMGHLPIVIGNKLSLSLAREFGFETFSDIIDEDYDFIGDMPSRIQCAIKTASVLRERVLSDNGVILKIREIGKSNTAWATSGFPRQYSLSFTEPILKAINFLI
jgi:hypothetical protein